MLSPYVRPSEIVPFSYPSSTWDLSPFDTSSSFGLMDPIQQQLLSDPLVRRTMNNARMITRDLQPILAADVLDLGDKFEVHADLPGVSKADLDVTIQSGLITIKGERKKKYEADDVWGTHRVERSHGKVSRTLTLPLNCDTEHADASFEGGVLKVVFPKLTTSSSSSKKLLIA